MRKNQRAREELEILYGAKCMLTGWSERLSYHHLIIKACDGGQSTVENGALLNREVHTFLHSEENRNKQLYNELNECLILYKLCLELNETECLNEWEAVKEQVRIRVR